ncbi:MAG: tol-pal system protein YbgF [Tatlockia sp.]|nr:tol-pal system protein YbgF [Tatlockia sp.]
MIKFHRLLLSLTFTCFLPLQVFAEAPVVDDSENFAILDEQQAAVVQPVAKAQLDQDGDEEVVALARDTHNGSTGNTADLVNKIQGLQQDIQELRGQLEVQTHDFKLLQQQQLAFYKDLDTRMRGPNSAVQSAELAPKQDPALGPTAQIANISQANPELAASNEKLVNATLPNPARGNPAEEQISYLAAYELVKNKHFDEALTAMQAFINQYPHGGYTANAQYWLGELFMVKRDFPKAIEHFEIVLRQFPSSSKAAASTLKIGYALAASGKDNEARSRLQQVLKNYPDTPTAQLATIKLESLGVS